ncbi:hypothetical protein ABW19_dt0207537 [Dactylella cylindrospora]|nr:hypothetical protein ABW19_dt0207537 [Dactylella cylindrospora]
MLFLRSPLGLRLSIGVAAPTLYLSSQLLHPRPRSILHCQAPSRQDQPFVSASQYPTYVRYPEDQRPSTLFNPNDFRQISTGSFAGVLAGYMVGRLSRMFAFVAVIAILIIQFFERKGFHIFPYQKIKGVVSEVDARRALTENWAFKWSFTSTFVLSAWFAN